MATKKTTKKKKTAATAATGTLKTRPAAKTKVVKKKKKTNASAVTAAAKTKTAGADAKPAARTTTTRKRKTTAKASTGSAASPKVNSPKKATTRAPVKVAPPAPPMPEIRKPLSRTQLRKVKTDLSRKDLDEYRRLLVQKRAEILGDVEALQTDARSDSGDHLSPEHMADIGSINYEQEFTLGLVESERKLVVEIDEALVRIREGTYGVCLERGVPIGRLRLDAKPWAKYCIEVVREKESRGEL